ncbi:MAG: isochorismate synthase [Flavobacterium sp.]|nr:isochorismate synthase [Flavobacterium sp.]
MSELFKKVKNHYKKELPFVVYCKPNSNKIIALFQKTNELKLLNECNDSGFALVSFDNEKRYIIPENCSDIYYEKVVNSDFIISKKIDSISNPNAKTSFEKLVEKGIADIQNGNLEKVVLSREIIVNLANIDIEIIFKSLVLHYKTAFNYCFYHPKIGFWIGATPEQFLKINQNKISTVALAGTQLLDEKQEVVWKKKEIKEQKIVTEYITENLKKHTQTISISEPYNFKAGNLIHIKTDVEATITDEKSIDLIIQDLHPTPAVCGFPKQKAKKFILENENYDREFYAGYLGEWNKDFETFKEHQTDLFVNLRCMKIENKEIKIFVGCGITAESIPENEYFETVNKSKTMLEIIS